VIKEVDYFPNERKEENSENLSLGFGRLSARRVQKNAQDCDRREHRCLLRERRHQSDEGKKGKIRELKKVVELYVGTDFHTKSDGEAARGNHAEGL